MGSANSHKTVAAEMKLPNDPKLILRAINRGRAISNVGNRQGVRRINSGKLRPLHGAVDFRAVRRGYGATGGIFVAKRRFGTCGRQWSGHTRLGAKTARGRKLYRNRPQPADARLRRIATTARHPDQMAPGGCSGAAV